MNRFILVVGPHRTGTSAVTKMITDWGASPGTGLSVPSSEDFEYYENLSINKIQHRLFEAFRGTWTSPILPRGWENSGVTKLARSHLREVLEKEYPGDGPFILKSTLATVLYPLWKGLGLDLTIVKTNRSHWDHINSLARFFKLNLSTALSLSKLYFNGQVQWPGDWMFEFKDLKDRKKVQELVRFLDSLT